MSEVRDLACGKWPRILEAAGVDPIVLNGHHHPCPACGGTDRFRYFVIKTEYGDPDFGSYYCSSCGPGDGLSLLTKMRGSFNAAANLVREILGNSNFKSLPIQPSKPVVRDLKKIHDSLEKVAQGSSRVIPGDTVWRYLKGTRWLDLNEFPKAIKIHPNLGYYQKGDGGKTVKVGEFAAMVAVVRSPDGRAVSLHRTFLSKAATKAPVECPKKLMKGLDGMHGGAIRLYPSTNVLAIAEGIETALAVHCLTGLPVWAAISSGMMKNIILPDDVKEVIIFADNDLPDHLGRRAGQEAAEALRIRLEAEGRKVVVKLPPVPGTDFADVWENRCKEKVGKEMAA